MLLVVWDDWGLRGLKGLTSGRKGEGETMCKCLFLFDPFESRSTVDV